MAKPQLVQIQVPKGDAKLLRTIDDAFARVADKSGAWLVCKPGCSQCCHGPFPISQLDAVRLRLGLEQLALTDPGKAAAIRRRAQHAVARLAASFPGDPKTGLLSTDEAAIERFEDYADDEPCPALSASHSKDGGGRCELYAARPLTCRVFGPPMQSLHMGDTIALGHCELCYHGATPEEVAACELDPGTDALEEKLNDQVEKRSGVRGQTIIAFALR
ncbi:MAG TPA: YkgJ family cysteine cluster protein [Terriglobales bacterium]|nr:YkgJ family cysteine cluster protein [Terriglobales bacterium]